MTPTDSHVLILGDAQHPTNEDLLRQPEGEEGVYVRVGSTNRRADVELIEELRRYARGEAYDEQPMPER